MFNIRNLVQNYQKVKVSHSLIAVGAVCMCVCGGGGGGGRGELETHCIFGTADEGGAHPSPFAALFLLFLLLLLD